MSMWIFFFADNNFIKDEWENNKEEFLFFSFISFDIVVFHQLLSIFIFYAFLFNRLIFKSNRKHSRIWKKKSSHSFSTVEKGEKKVPMGWKKTIRHDEREKKSFCRSKQNISSFFRLFVAHFFLLAYYLRFYSVHQLTNNHKNPEVRTGWHSSQREEICFIFSLFFFNLDYQQNENVYIILRLSDGKSSG